MADLASSFEQRIPPVLLALTCGIAMWGLSTLAPGLEAHRVSRVVVAVPMALVGAYFGGAGLRSFRRARTTVNPLKPEGATSLVRSGVYRVTRNPMYLGLALLLLAWAGYLASPWALAVVAGFVVYIDRMQIVPEERALAARFGPEYESYRAGVRRWL